MPIIEVGKIIGQVDLKRRIKSSLLGILNLRYLLENQVEILSKPLEVQVHRGVQA